MTEGKFRVWCIVNPPGEPEYKGTYRHIKTAVDVLDRWARFQLKVWWIESNVFGIERWNPEDREWEECDEWEYGYNSGWDGLLEEAADG